MRIVEASPSWLREELLRVAQRPGMYMLDENYRQVVAFMMGVAVANPAHLDLLLVWSVSRLRCVRENLGWPYALGVLAADQVARRPECGDQSTTPLVRQFLMLVCEYLGEISAPGGRAGIQARYEQTRRERDEASLAFLQASGAVVNSPEWYEEFRAWELSFAPVLRSASADPRDPWASPKR